MRAMFVKQGISVSDDVGRGELNAAYSGLGVITGGSSNGLPQPSLAARLSDSLPTARANAYFSSPPAGLPSLLRLGPGAVFTLAGWLNVLAWWFVKSLDRKDLFIDDDTPAKDESQD